jgi:hypothetical protein
MGSPFSSKTHDTIPLPFDPPHTAVVRTLTGREVDRAQAEHVRSFINGRSTRGWAAVFARKLAEGTASNADAQKVLDDPLNGYDRYAVVKAGLVSWSYEPPLTSETRDAAIEDLVDDAIEYLATEIMRRTKPSLFMSQEDAQKEAQAPASVA